MGNINLDKLGRMHDYIIFDTSALVSPVGSQKDRKYWLSDSLKIIRNVLGFVRDGGNVYLSSPVLNELGEYNVNEIYDQFHMDRFYAQKRKSLKKKGFVSEHAKKRRDSFAKNLDKLVKKRNELVKVLKERNCILGMNKQRLNHYKDLYSSFLNETPSRRLGGKLSNEDKEILILALTNSVEKGTTALVSNDFPLLVCGRKISQVHNFYGIDFYLSKNTNEYELFTSGNYIEIEAHLD